MDDEDNTPIVQAHRYGRQACEAQARGHWQQAIDKHTRAAQQFQSLTTYTNEPQALLALRLLSQHHLDAAQHIQRTLYHESPSYQSTPRIITTTTIPPTSTTTSTSEQLTHLTRLLAILRTKPFEMEQRDFDILMGTFEELRAIVAKPNLPSQAVRKSHADIETDLQSHLHFGRDIQSRMSTLTGRPEEMSTLRDLIPTLIRQHASLAQNEAALQRENESLRQIIHAMQENYAQKSAVLTTALTTSFRPMITTTTTITDTNMDVNKLLSDKMKLEKQVHILSKQLKAEMAQVKKQNAVIEEQKQRWHNLKEAARNKRERERNRIAGTGTAPANMQPVPVPGPGPGPGNATSTSTSTSSTTQVTSTFTSSSTPSHRPTLSVGSATPSSSSAPVKK